MAQTYFRYDPDETENERSQTFELTDRFMMPELVWIAKNLKLDLSEMGAGTQTFVSMFLVLRRQDPQKWNLKAFESLSTENLVILDPDEEETPAQPDEETPDPTAGLAPDDEAAAKNTN